jgi:hypothetical protein
MAVLIRTLRRGLARPAQGLALAGRAPRARMAKSGTREVPVGAGHRPARNAGGAERSGVPTAESSPVTRPRPLRPGTR